MCLRKWGFSEPSIFRGSAGAVSLMSFCSASCFDSWVDHNPAVSLHKAAIQNTSGWSFGFSCCLTISVLLTSPLPHRNLSSLLTSPGNPGVVVFRVPLKIAERKCEPKLPVAQPWPQDRIYIAMLSMPRAILQKWAVTEAFFPGF